MVKMCCPRTAFNLPPNHISTTIEKLNFAVPKIENIVSERVSGFKKGKL